MHLLGYAHGYDCIRMQSILSFGQSASSQAIVATRTEHRLRPHSATDADWYHADPNGVTNAFFDMVHLSVPLPNPRWLTEVQ
jgi:hypothetical protein